MTQDEIIEMARESGLIVNSPHLMPHDHVLRGIEAFAKLVAAKTEAHYMQLFLDPENQPTQFGTATQEYREREIKEEREACANLCLETYPTLEGAICASRIRARGEA